MGIAWDDSSLSRGPAESGSPRPAARSLVSGSRRSPPPRRSRRGSATSCAAQRDGAAPPTRRPSPSRADGAVAEGIVRAGRNRAFRRSQSAGHRFASRHLRESAFDVVAPFSAELRFSLSPRCSSSAGEVGYIDLASRRGYSRCVKAPALGGNPRDVGISRHKTASTSRGVDAARPAEEAQAH